MKKRFLFLVVMSLLVMAFLARDTLLTKGVELYVSRKMVSQGWDFEEIQREKNTLKLKNLSYKNSSGKILVEQVDSSFHLSLFPLQLQPTVAVSHVSVDILSGQSSDDFFIGLLFCLEDSRLDLKLSIDEGLVSGVLENPFVFSFKPGIEKRDIGTLSIQDLEKNAFLLTHLKWEGESLVSLVEIEKGKTSDLMALTSFMQSDDLKKWSQGQGEISASIKSRFHPKHGLEEMDGMLDLQGISFSHASSGIHILSQSVKGTIFFSSDALKEKSLSFWREVEVFLTFEDTHVKVDKKECQLGIEEALGEIRITPTDDPYLKMGGKILSDNLLIPFEIEGKGQLLDKGAYWLQTRGDFFLSKKSPHIDVLFSQNEKEESVVQVGCVDFSKEIFNVLQLAFPVFNLPNCYMTEGEFGGKFVGSFEKGLPKTLEFSGCELEGVDFSLPAENFALKSQSVSFSGSVEKNEEDFLELSSLEASIRNLDLTIQNKKMLQSLSAKVGVQLGEFTSSYVEGFCEGIWGSVQVLDSGSKDIFHIECKAFSSDLMQKVKGAQAPQNKVGPVFLALDISSQDEAAHGAATIRLISKSGVEEDIEVQLSLDRKISRNVKELFSDWDFASCKGSFKTERLSSETAGSWTRPWLGSLTPKGFLKGAGAFDGSGVSLDIAQADFDLSDGTWDIRAKLGNQEKQIHLAYEYTEGLWKGAVPIDFLRLQNPLLKLDTEVQDSLIFFEGDKMWTDHFQANTFGSKLLGKMVADKSGVHITSKAFEGALKSLVELAPQLASFDGTFAVEDRGCSLEGQKQGNQWTWAWKASFNLKGLSSDFGEKGKVHQASACLEGNSLGDFKLKNLKGTYSLATSSCPFTLSDFNWSTRAATPSDFSFLAKDGKREWANVQGKVEKKKDGVTISLSPQSNMLGLVMDVAPFVVNSQMEVTPIQFSSLIKLEQVPSYLTMWKEMGLPVITTSLLSSYKGSFQVQGLYDVQKSSWKASFRSPEVYYAQSSLGKAYGTILGDGKSMKIESCQIGDWSAKGAINTLSPEWNISSLAVEWPVGKCLMKGKYIPLTSELKIPAFSASLIGEKIGNIQVQGSFDGAYNQETGSFQGSGLSRLTATLPPALSMSFDHVKEIPFTFDLKKGVQVESLEWNLNSYASSKKKIGKITAKTVEYSIEEKRLLVQGVSVNLPKESYKVLQNCLAFAEILEEIQVGQDIDIQGDLDFSSQDKKITGSMKNGVYTVQGKDLEVKQMTFSFEEDDFIASCQTKCQEEPLFLQLQMKLGAAPAASLLVKDHTETKGVTAHLKKSQKEGWFCESVQGSLKGMNIKAQKDAKLNIYDLQVNADLSEVPTLLPKTWATNMKKWGLGKGYSFHGILVLDSDKPFKVQSLKGDLLGEGFEFLGKTFDLLNAKVNFTENKGSIHTLKLQDDLANLSIKTIDLAYNSEISSWDIISPVVYVKDFAPALFLKGGNERGLEIKNLSLYDLKGVLSDVKSFEANGALNFSSETKKEFSFWDVPLGMMKDWGLDPGILTPITGEADFILRRGCFCFTGVRNVFSEGKRSQFYLVGAGNDSYLSLDGNWHVDLAMKQNVVWKVTEDLVLSIRGTIEKPKYSLKSNKKYR